MAHKNALEALNRKLMNIRNSEENDEFGNKFESSFISGNVLVHQQI